MRLRLLVLTALLGLVGTPPTAVFIGKLTTATAAWDGDQAWLAVLVFINSLASLFYYLRWIIPSYRSGTPAHNALPTRFVPTPWSAYTAITASTATLLLGVIAGAVWTIVNGTLTR